MATWKTVLANIREDIQDTSTNPRYSDKLLFLYARDAIRDYSQYFPLRVDALEIAPANGVFPLPSDFLDEIFVECPRGTYLEPRPLRPGLLKVASVTPYRYQIEGGSIHLDASTSQSIWLTYSAFHSVPTSETDSTAEISVPETDMELIHLYVRARIAAQIRFRQANLDRYREDGRRDDNPLAFEYKNLMDEYRIKIQERTPTRAHWLIYQRG